MTCPASHNGIVSPDVLFFMMCDSLPTQLLLLQSCQDSVLIYVVVPTVYTSIYSGKMCCSFQSHLHLEYPSAHPEAHEQYRLSPQIGIMGRWWKTLRERASGRSFSHSKYAFEGDNKTQTLLFFSFIPGNEVNKLPHHVLPP